MIDVAFTPDAVRTASVAVVIDVLRAASSITQALAAGYRRVLCCRTLEEAEALRAPGRVLAGERACLKPPGFELGNSPVDFQQPRADEVVLTTTNGCPALLAAAASSEEVLIGCLLNLRALIASLDPAGDLILVCAGTDGAPALEDAYLAGRIAAALPGERTDAALVAQAVAVAYPSPGAALSATPHAQALRRAGLEGDIDWCAQESVLDLVPRLVGLAGGVATVAYPARSSEREALVASAPRPGLVANTDT